MEDLYNYSGSTLGTKRALGRGHCWGSSSVVLLGISVIGVNLMQGTREALGHNYQEMVWVLMGILFSIFIRSTLNYEFNSKLQNRV